MADLGVSLAASAPVNFVLFTLNAKPYTPKPVHDFGDPTGFLGS